MLGADCALTMAWEGSTRRSRLPPDWPATRLRILERDSHRCTWIENGKRCTERATDVDHRVPGDDHSDRNLRSLCPWHHRRKSSAEGAAARAPQPTQRRPPEQHPGVTA